MKEEKGLKTMVKSCFLPIVIYYVVNNATVLLAQAGVEHLGENILWENYLLTAGKMAAMLLGAGAVFPCYQREVKKRETVEEKRPELWDYVKIMATGILLALGFNFLFAAAGLTESSESYRQVAEVQFALPLWLALPFYMLLSPIAEELVFRGIVYQALKRLYSLPFAIFASGILFGAFHGNIVQMLYGTMMGMVMAFIYEKYHKLSAPVLFHGAANGAVYLWTYFF